VVQIISEYNFFFEDNSAFEFRLGRSKKLATADYIRYIFKYFHDKIKIIYFYLYLSSYWSKNLALKLGKEFQYSKDYKIEFHAVTD
jgi:hypothetical protein